MNVLAVDDREENRLILEQKLKLHGYSPVVAANGVEALQKLRSTKFDAVITDLLMPEMDGYQLTHAIKTDENLRDTPVIIYTGTYTDPKDEALARNLGASAFIIKPAEDDRFFRTLAETIGRATRGELPSHPLAQDEAEYFRTYTARLIHKLEDTVRDAAEANRKLRELNATLEEKVAAATAELREANAELEAFVSSASHDLRSPLRTIEGMSAVLLENDPPLSDEERRHLLQRMAHGAAQMQRLIEDLLAYSRLKSSEVKLTAVSLDAVLRTTLERLHEEIEKTKAHLDIAPGLPPVLAFEPVLVQALVNLVGNAIKFVRPGEIPHVRITAERNDSWVRLAVIDNGIGISPEGQAKIFHAFHRLHSAAQYPGTGVGLAIVKHAIDKMGGRLGVQSTLNVGSTFWLELPAIEASQAAVA
jgi:signal transduction histidine kinase